MEQEDCCICLENIEANEGGKLILSCKHQYHIDCGFKWIGKLTIENQIASCPMCRKMLIHKNECLPKEILEKKKEYVCAYRNQLHGFLLRKGGRGISNTLWNSFKKSEFTYRFIEGAGEGNVVFSLPELEMLMITNGCKENTITYAEWDKLYDEDIWE